MQHGGAARVGIASASDNTSSSRRGVLFEVGGGRKVGSRPGFDAQLAAACGDEPAQRAERRVAAAVFVRRHDGLRRARPAREVGLRHPVPATDGHEQLGGRHRASISLCLCPPKPLFRPGVAAPGPARNTPTMQRPVPPECGGRGDPRPHRSPDRRQRRPHHRVPAARARHPRGDRRLGRRATLRPRRRQRAADPVPHDRTATRDGDDAHPVVGHPDPQHARPRDGDAAATAVRAPRRDRHRRRRRSTRRTGSPRSTSPTTSCARRCRARSTRTSPRSTRRIAIASFRSRASRCSRRTKRSPSWNSRSRGLGLQRGDDGRRDPATVPGARRRRVRAGSTGSATTSAYDYTPLWEKCVELGVSPTFHSTGAGWGSRTSPTNYVFNHIGNFAAAGELTARSLFFGGVPMRFPALRFAFLEGGAAWACNLLSDLLGHWEKRNREAIAQYDPAALDRDQLAALFERHAEGRVRDRLDRLADGLGMLSEPIVGDDIVDEFAESLVQSPEDIVDIFTSRVLLRLRGRRPDGRARLRPRAQPLRRAAAGDLRERHRPLGRPRHSRTCCARRGSSSSTVTSMPPTSAPSPTTTRSRCGPARTRTSSQAPASSRRCPERIRHTCVRRQIVRSATVSSAPQRQGRGSRHALPGVSTGAHAEPLIQT